MEYNKNEVMEIVREVLGDNATGVYIDYAQYEYSEESPIISELIDSPWLVESTSSAEVKLGATKLVIVPRAAEIPYVIKINLSGVFRAMDEDDCLTNVELIKTNTRRDILDEENAMIDDVCDELGEVGREFIKPNIYVGDYNGIKVYIQEKLRTTQEQLEIMGSTYYAPSTFDKKTSRAVDSLEEQYESVDLYWEFLYNMIEYYGEPQTRKLLEQIEKNDIYDLHVGNYGYDNEGYPTLIDIGGYDRYFWDN